MRPSPPTHGPCGGKPDVQPSPELRRVKAEVGGQTGLMHGHLPGGAETGETVLVGRAPEIDVGLADGLSLTVRIRVDGVLLGGRVRETSNIRMESSGSTTLEWDHGVRRRDGLGRIRVSRVGTARNGPAPTVVALDTIQCADVDARDALPPKAALPALHIAIVAPGQTVLVIGVSLTTRGVGVARFGRRTGRQRGRVSGHAYRPQPGDDQGEQ